MKAHYAPPDQFSSDRSPRLVIPFDRSPYSMNNQPVHVPYNMAPSTALTPREWKFVSIHPDSGSGRFKLGGFASQQPWLPGDLKALKVEVKGNKTWGLTKARALEIGLQLENSMRKQNGMSSLEGVPAPADPPPATKPIQRKPPEAQQSLL